MFSIKGSCADCSTCSLLDAPSCILESNSVKPTDVEVVFVSENPGKEEVKREVPLIGKAGQVFRVPFNKFIKSPFKWLLTNCVLCMTINRDGTTGNPTDDIINRCRENCFKIIETCKPNLIVLMGAAPMKAFGIAESGITSLRGQMYKWKDFDVLLTVHPSFVNRNMSYKNKFENDIKKAAELLGANLNSTIKIEKSSLKKKGVFYYKIPGKFYLDEYRLIDVQFLEKSNEVLYIFRDKANKKVFYKIPDDFYCYQCPEEVEARKVVKFDNLHQIKVSYKQRLNLDPDATYEGDVRLTVKHAMDYFIQNQGEAPEVDLNIMFLDIENYSKTKEFPNAEEAQYPIAMLTYSYHGETITYVVDNKILLRNSNVGGIQKQNNVIICKSEREMLNAFIKDLRRLEPDILTGWNCVGYDIPYIVNRCKKVGILSSMLSKFNEINMDLSRGYADIMGIVVLDQLTLYRKFTFTKKENYKLDTIAMEEIGRGKEHSGEGFSPLYEKDVNEAIKYNRGDVSLLVDLEETVRHVALQNELRKICNSCFRGAQSTMGQLDSLIVSFLKRRGFASKNAGIHEESSTFEGAFVKEPSTGIHDFVVDFDFTSLYPSLVLTYNIGVNTFVMKFKDTENGYFFIYDRDKLPEKVSIIVDPLFKAQEVEISKEQLVKKVEESKLVYTISGCFFKPHSQEISFYSEIIDFLLSTRREFKDLMFKAKESGQDKEKEMYNIRQLVMKVLANAMYGVLGNNVYRFFARDCARSITLSGQESIKTIILAGDNYLESIKSNSSYVKPKNLTLREMYGDTIPETKYVITGDTDSLFATFADFGLNRDREESEIVSEIMEKCDKVQKFLNKEVITELVSLHNVPLERNKLDLKNELIISRGLFLAKKRYAINVVSQEGRETDEIISMGLETKRSDFPSYTKKCLEELLNLVLKSKTVSLSKIFQFVKNREKEILERVLGGNKVVARPVSFTKKVKDYKKVPHGVLSMLNWNELEYTAFQPGARGYLFKLHGIDLGRAPKEVVRRYDEKFLKKGKKLETICVPVEESKLPSYYIPDVRSMVKFAWEDRVSLLLDPLTAIKEEILTF